MAKFRNMGADPKMGPLADKVAKTANAIGFAAAECADNIGDGLALTLIAATGIFAVSGALICDDEKNAPELPLFIGILAGLCSRPVPDGSVAFDYNAGIICEALDMFERATGHKAETFLHPSFIAAGREYVNSGKAEGDRLLAEFQAARRNNMN